LTNSTSYEDLSNTYLTEIYLSKNPEKTACSGQYFTAGLSQGHSEQHGLVEQPPSSIYKRREILPEKTEDDESWEDRIHVDYLMLKLSDLLKKEKDEIGYEYDFGDGWLHNIVLEKIPVSDPGVNNPQCTAGKRNCPPEDCGGPFGYSNLLTVISNPRHEEYEEMMKWTGGNFDPESFDKETINDLLKKEDFGIVPFRLC